jgi:UDPglucose 6-dehydrogenase
MRLSIIGTGYVGLVTGACFAQLGHHVTCIDIDPDKIQKINQGISPIYEEGLDILLTTYKDRITATTDYKAIINTDVTFLCVGTPSKKDGSLDISYLTEAATQIAQTLQMKKATHIVVVKSTVLPGTTQEVVLPLLEQHTGKKVGIDIGLAMNPEFLKEGVAIQDFLKPDRIVIGLYDEHSRKILRELYKEFNCPILETSLSAAEMIKYASNAFLATKISFINEIGNLCKKQGIDTYDVAEGMGLDKRIGRSFLDSGIGWGGSCLKGEEKILLYEKQEPHFMSFKDCFQSYSKKETGVYYPKDLKVLTWNIDKLCFEFHPIKALTKRLYTGNINRIQTSMGKSIFVTSDHPMLVVDGKNISIKRSSEINEGCRLPVLKDIPTMTLKNLDLIQIISISSEFPTKNVYLKPRFFHLKDHKNEIQQLIKKINYNKKFTYNKSHDFFRKNYLPLDVFLAIEQKLPFKRSDFSLYTAIGATTYVPAVIKLDEKFWRFIGYYLSEGCINSDNSGHGKKPRKRIMFSFNYHGEEDYVKDVEHYLSEQGIKFSTVLKKTSTQIIFSSRIFAYLLDNHLDCGTNSYTHKIPDLIYTQRKENRFALLSGLFRGDGSIAFPKHTNAVVYEYGSISKELIQGMIMLLHSIDVTPSYKTSKSAKSTAPAHFIRISSRDQIEVLKKVFKRQDQRQIEKKLISYNKIITPTGHRKHGGVTSVKVRKNTATFEQTYVYSLEVEGNHNFVTTDGLIVHNCFPKDIDALIPWAHEQHEHVRIIESTKKVNEDQPERLITLLKKHIPILKGKTIGILGLAFKPDTDDIRESRAIPIVKELLRDKAHIKAYDPQAMENFKTLYPTIEYCTKATQVLSADAILIVTKWKEFTTLNYQGTIVIDGRRLDEAKNATIYEGVCW